MADDNTKDVGQEIDMDKELAGRVEEFNKEFIPLLGKYQLGLGASAYLTPDGKIAARPILFNDVKASEEPKDAVTAA